jgi:hypothetical protein
MKDAGAFAEDIYGAGAGAAFTHDVGFQDRLCGAFEVIAGDLFDEPRDVNVRGAGGGAGCIEAVEAAVGLGDGCGLIEARVEIRKTRSNLVTTRTLLVEGQRLTQATCTPHSPAGDWE